MNLHKILITCCLMTIWGALENVSGQTPCNLSGRTPVIQNTKKGFKILSILVDACDGNNEGQNEMIRLVSGFQSLKVANFNISPFKNGMVNWGNTSNPWRGFAEPNNQLAQKINSINQQIRQQQNCGYFKLLGPSESVPPHSQFLIITSTAFNPAAHDFSELQDTMYVLVQIEGNTAGHFVNFGSSETRTMILIHGSYRDTIVYNRSLLTKTNGSKGGEDGASVDFDLAGKPTYTNYGCKIPVPPTQVNAGKNIYLDCDAVSVNLNGLVSGFPCYHWEVKPSLNGAYFDDSSKLNARYYLPKTKPDSLVFTLVGNATCGGMQTDDLTVIFPKPPKAQLFMDTSNGQRCFQNLSEAADVYEWRWRKEASPKDSLWNTFKPSETPCIPIDTFWGEICLTAVNTQNGCVDSTCNSWKDVQINRAPFIYIANVFTPGVKDGVNDELRIVSKGITQFKWLVYDRWGSLVFETENPHAYWTGNVSNGNTECPAGVYFSTLDYQFQDGIKHQKNWSITLIR